MNKRKEAVRGIKFALFSVSAGIIELASFALLEVFTPWPYWPNYLIALVLSVLWNFTLNRRFTFRASGNVPIAMLKVACFYIVFTPLSTLLGNFLAENCGWNVFLVTGLNMALNLVSEYFYDRYYVYRNTVDTNKKAKESFDNPQEEE